MSSWKEEKDISFYPSIGLFKHHLKDKQACKYWSTGEYK